MRGTHATSPGSGAGPAMALALGLLALAGSPGRAAATTANDLCQPGADPCVVSTVVAVTDGSIIDVGNRELRLAPNGTLSVGGGTMTIRGRLLTMQGVSTLSALGTGSAPGGVITVEFAEANLGGTITANGTPAGQVTITIQNAVQITGTVIARALHPEEVGGQIDISAGSAVLSTSGRLEAWGGGSAIGGDITVATRGNLVVDGLVAAYGGDGGSIDLGAGGSGGAGDLTVNASAVLDARSNTAGNFGGTIDLSADGDNVTSGRIVVDGTLIATGQSGTELTGGGDGGCIALSASGDVRIPSASAVLDVNGGGPDGSGGEVDLSTVVGVIETRGMLRAQGPGSEGTGGAVSIDATADAVVAGTLLATGGDGGGGEITVATSGASVEIGPGTVIDANAGSGGSGGSIAVESGFGIGSEPRSVAIEGRLTASGGAGAPGGTIEVSAGDSARVDAAGSLIAAGGSGARGGVVSITVDSGPAQIDGPLTASGGGSGPGGTIAIDADETVLLNAQLDARGTSGGGLIGVAAVGDIDVRRPLLVQAGSGPGGTVEIVSQGQIAIGAAVTADGGTAAGRTMIEGCEVTVCAPDVPACGGGGTGAISSLGPDGINRIVGRDGSFVFGSMRADATTGRNELVYNGDAQREPLVLGSVTPGAMLIVDASVLVCPVCGNRAIEPPETCDDGNQLDGDGCSARCQIENPVRGDVNADSVLSPADREFLAAEIFDGDGDGIGLVSGGAFRGGPGADANQDGRVTAADFVAIAELLAP